LKHGLPPKFRCASLRAGPDSLHTQQQDQISKNPPIGEAKFLIVSKIATNFSGKMLFGGRVVDIETMLAAMGRPGSA
jgi:hypothetical protein